MSDARKRIAAKKLNDHLKLFSTSLNTVALTVFGAAFILPLVSGSNVQIELSWILVSLALHFGAHVAIRLLRSEE